MDRTIARRLIRTLHLVETSIPRFGIRHSGLHLVRCAPSRQNGGERRVYRFSVGADSDFGTKRTWRYVRVVESGMRTYQVEVSFPCFGPVCSPFMVIVGHRAGVRRPAACRCTQATLPGKAHYLPVCAIARPLPCPNNQRRPHAWLCNPVPRQPLEAGMMNPRRLSTVPAPLLRSVILATGVVGLLAAFGPAGFQNTGAAPHKDISAPSLSTEQELAGAPQPSSMLNDDLGQTAVAIADLSLAGAVPHASIALNNPDPAPDP